jgi:hypothetical protein
MIKFFETHRKEKIWVAVALVISILVTIYELIYYKFDVGHIIRAVSDGFFISGFIFVMVGLIIFINRMGGFDLIGYVNYIVERSFSKRKREEEKKKSYYDYTIANRDEKHAVSYIFIIGLVFVMISLIIALLA